MEFIENMYGAFAKLLIKSDLNIEKLGHKLKEKLGLSNLRIENNEYEPYNLVVYAEVLGFEITLTEFNAEKEWVDYSYILEVITSDSFEEIANGHMHDISLWMAHYIAITCGVTVGVLDFSKEAGWTFCRNKVTKKLEINRVGSEN